MSLIVTAFSPVTDAREVLTPQLRLDRNAQLVLLDLGRGRNRLGGSALAQVHGLLGDEVPDAESAGDLSAFFTLVQKQNAAGNVLAYHDRSDGGLLVTLLEMAFAGHCGLAINLSELTGTPLEILFNEELGAVVQVVAAELEAFLAAAASVGLGDCCHVLGSAVSGEDVLIQYGENTVLQDSRVNLQQLWARTSYEIQSIRDNPDSAKEEFERLAQPDPGLSAHLSFDPDDDICSPFINRGVRPKIAILREQGVNGHVEMAAAFHRAGFEPFDVHMSDILSGRSDLSMFKGLVACGGFSYGDVLGAGEGWAKSVLFNSAVRDQFSAFFERSDSFTLGVCNGCQMISRLNKLIPGASHWPRFVRNQSEQFEARLVLARVEESPSLFLTEMAGSHLPIAVAHGEGRAHFASEQLLRDCQASGTVAMRYIETDLSVATG